MALNKPAAPDWPSNAMFRIAEAAVELVERVHQEFGRIDALINGAGPYHRVSLLQETNAGWHDMFDNNLHPVFYLTQAVVPIMKDRKSGDASSPSAWPTPSS